ncbi:hypothetical protein ACFU99_04550 [Streptomyces sp. NPDC057654]|uniref:hypothetical protein n=1 Tax=Streptomyces sp. NPDC057654 TaxID=3346196 RepID=UPI0036C1619A
MVFCDRTIPGLAVRCMRVLLVAALACAGTVAAPPTPAHAAVATFWQAKVPDPNTPGAFVNASAPPEAHNMKTFWRKLPPADPKADPRQDDLTNLPATVYRPANMTSPYPAVSATPLAQAWPAPAAAAPNHYRFYFHQATNPMNNTQAPVQDQWVAYGGQFDNTRRVTRKTLEDCYKAQYPAGGGVIYPVNDWVAAGFTTVRNGTVRARPDWTQAWHVQALGRLNAGPYPAVSYPRLTANPPNPPNTGAYYEYDTTVRPAIPRPPNPPRGWQGRDASRIIRNDTTHETYFTQTHYCNFTGF